MMSAKLILSPVRIKSEAVAETYHKEFTLHKLQHRDIP
jgi:hypothetical protein